MLKQKYTPVSILVYGSYADGSNNEHSDFDALVISSNHAKCHKGRIFFQDLSMFYVPFGIATVFRSALESVGDIRYCSAVGIGTPGLRIAFSYILKLFLWDRAIAYAEAVAWCMETCKTKI